MSHIGKNKILVKVIGYLIVAVSFIYIIKSISKMDLSVLKFPNKLNVLSLLFLLCFVYAFAYFLLAMAWKMILQISFNYRERLPFIKLFTIYTKSNIAKYLPGNIMGFVMRNYLGKDLTLKQSEIAMSSFFEIIFLVLSAILITICTSLKQLIKIFNNLFTVDSSKIGLFLCILCILIFLLILLIIAYKRNVYNVKGKIGIEINPSTFLSKRFLFSFLKIFILYIFTFALFGLILVCIFLVLGMGEEIANPVIVVKIVSSYILSWLAGYITPGASAGIGVRESVILTLLSPVFGYEITLMAAFLYRVMTVIGDVIAYFCGLLLGKYAKCN